jgi:aryl-alcohol dehydrogenase-like predicted oxidoreductase
VPAFERLRDQGKARFIGITAVGDTAALHQVVDARAFQSAQVSYNLLNPTAGAILPPNYPAQDYGRLLDQTSTAGIGTIGIRVLAGGALSGDVTRHPIASPPPEPIGSGRSYDADLERARRLLPLVAEGYADNLAEAAIRYVIANKAISTILVGMATIDQFEQALAAVNKGPFSAAALQRVQTLQQTFVGEQR